MIIMGVGTRLKKILDEKEVTIKELSLMSGVSINTLYGITKRDNETIKMDILYPIAESLGIPPQYLLGLNGTAPQWTDGELEEYSDLGLVDTADGLLSEIVHICTGLTTEGRLKCLEYVKSIKNKYKSKETETYETLYEEWNKLRIDEIRLMHDKGKITDLDFQKLMLIITKKLLIPFSNYKNGVVDEDGNRIRSYLHEAGDIVDTKILNKEIAVSLELYNEKASELRIDGKVLNKSPKL